MSKYALEFPVYDCPADGVICGSSRNEKQILDFEEARE
jgi:hypothetical protein